jgi:methyl-accepting chemotaxis protein
MKEVTRHMKEVRDMKKVTRHMKEVRVMKEVTRHMKEVTKRTKEVTRRTKEVTRCMKEVRDMKEAEGEGVEGMAVAGEGWVAVEGVVATRNSPPFFFGFS